MAADPGKLDRIVADARRAAESREQGYREKALKIYPWICGRCAREFTRTNLVNGSRNLTQLSCRSEIEI